MRSKSPELMSEIKKYIEDYYLQNRQSPSTTKIAEAVGIARGTAYKSIPMFADTYTNVAGWSFLKYDENAELDYNNPIEEIGFTNSYSAKKPVVSSEPTEPTKPDDTIKSPQTGDTSNMILWIALLLVSGSAAIGTTVVSRKKKYNR